MSIKFPVVPNVPGVPSLQSFPGVASITASIEGTVLSVTSGIGSIGQGLSLSGLGISPNTILTSGLTSIQGVAGGVIGQATVSVSQAVSHISMLASGSLADLVPSIGDLMDGDSDEVVLGAGDAQWGIYLGGAPVLVPDSVIAIDYKKDWHISDYPIELGDFETYNKVRLPYEVRVTVTKGGAAVDRSDFLDTLETIADSLDLYDVVTPEITYHNANIDHFDYRRTSENGVSLLSVTLWLQEVRVEANATFTQPAEPSAASEVNVGNVQPEPVTAVEEETFQGHGATGSW